MGHTPMPSAGLSRLRSPGYQYARLGPDGSVELCFGGKARLPKQPVNARTSFNAYSIAKTLTAAAVLLLAETGKLELDSPLSHYLALPFARSPTLRQTLCHLGGLPNPLPLAWVHPVEAHAGFNRKAFVDEVLDRHRRLRTAPGRSLHYSNLGYLLLGEVVEIASGKPCENYLEDELIASLNLPADAVLGFSLPSAPQHADGHIRRFGLLDLLLACLTDRRRLTDGACGRWRRIRPHYANGAAFGGLIANAAGLCAYLKALRRDDWPSPQVHQQLFATVSTANGVRLPRTMGWFSGELGGQPYFTHAGGGAGYYCEARLYPEAGCGSVIMLNRAGVSDARLLDRLDQGWQAAITGAKFRRPTDRRPD